MAVLTDTVRIRLWRATMRFLSSRLESANYTKPDLQAAINAADDWLNLNAAAYNTALTVPFRTNATFAQKALILAVVALARYDTQLLARLLGDVS